ncbi:MAG: FAD-binding domain-containing protein [Pseudomonadota bacterium]
MELGLERQDDRLQTDWPATRDEGLRRLDAFAQRMGSHYRGHRNRDSGPGRRDNVSLLSPYIARRLVTEAEAIDAALARHRPSTCEKFVQEVVWRTYFKGWLEIRPSVWLDYRTGLDRDLAMLKADEALAGDIERAETGQTGIEAFDVWARELVETGYLHNHARMWFASIWCFTLGLPWRIGADFFLRHLLDGDAASNTLGWRWVAGLHTQGKNYAATASNIAKYTDDRLGGPLTATGLARNPVPLDEGPLPPRGTLRHVPPLRVNEGVAVLLTTEDLGVESLGLPSTVRDVATLQLTHRRSPRAVSDMVAAFDRMALDDAAARVGTNSTVQLADEDLPQALVKWAQRVGASTVVTGYLNTGWVRDRLLDAAPALAAANIDFREVQRPWDAVFHPYCTAGFFKVKKEIPAILASLGHAC